MSLKGSNHLSSPFLFSRHLVISKSNISNLPKIYLKHRLLQYDCSFSIPASLYQLMTVSRQVEEDPKSPAPDIATTNNGAPDAT
jgi:hypothetical protein